MLFAGTLVGCDRHPLPTSPSVTVSGSDLASQPVTIDLPIRPGDSVSIAYGLWPFGVHGSVHSVDGHPGYDFEYRAGASVYAAAEGRVDNVIVDTNDPSRFSVQLRHHRNVGDYFSSYSNLASVPAAITPGAWVTRGQALGLAGTFSSGTSGMTHFQVVDPTGGSTARAADGYMADTAQAQLHNIWKTAAYVQEWCEPYLDNVAAKGFPMSRAWTKQSGDGPVTIVLSCVADGAKPQYSILGASGATMETGTLTLGWWERPVTTVDFVSSTGAVRLGVYDIVDGSMKLSLAPAGASRPSLDEAASYTTGPAGS
jgi:hypothetical protein